jgi:hypothetical protein
METEKPQKVDWDSFIGRRKTPMPDVETVKDNEFISKSEELNNNYYAIRFRNGDYFSLSEDKSLINAIKFPISLTREEVIRKLRKTCFSNAIESLTDYVIVKVTSQVKVTSEVRSERIKKNEKITQYNAFSQLMKKKMKSYVK